jgi:predicted glutamine amidotransferase
MCGIAGLVLSDAEKVNANVLACALLLNIEERGRDATGAAWFDPDGVLMTQKSAMPARWFVQGAEIHEDATNIILHTRAATQGSEKDNNNNHPVITGGVVGVHNGVLWNDDSLFRKMGVERIAEVDTEAAFAAIAYGTQIHDDGKPRLAADLKGVLEEIDGSAALAWQLVGKPNELHLARVSQSPLVVARTKGGSLVFASTLAAIKAGLAAAGLELKDHAYAKEGQYFKFEGTELADSFDFTPSYSPVYSGYSSGYSWKSYSGSSSTTTTKPKVTVTTTTTTPSPEFRGWLKPVELMAHITHMFSDIPKVDEERHHIDYLHRERAIDNFLEDEKTYDGDNFGSLYRVGHEVITDLPGFTGTLHGHIVAMPQYFPHGEYLIRVQVPNKRYQEGYEPLLVSRELNEFIVVSDTSTEDAIEVVEEEVVVMGELEAGKKDELADA